MNLKINGRSVDVLDKDCSVRRCYSLLADKGSFTQGVGYTLYHAHERWVCGTRHLHGCPLPIPEADPEIERERWREDCRALEYYRCCHAPRVRQNLKARRQRCLTCGVWLAGRILQAVREGRLKDKFDCLHADCAPSIVKDWWECPNCHGAWEHKPERWESPQHTQEELCQELWRRWLR